MSTFKGREYVDLRVNFRGDDGEMRPSKEEITLSLDLLPELEAGLKKLRERNG